MTAKHKSTPYLTRELVYRYVLQGPSAATSDIVRRHQQKDKSVGYGADIIEAFRARDRNQ